MTDVQDDSVATGVPDWWTKIYDPDSPDTSAAAAPQPEPTVDDEPDTELSDEADAPESLNRWWQRQPPTPETEPATPPEAAPAPAERPPRAVGEGIRQWHQGMDPRRAARWRWALYNSTAAATGWGLDLVHYAGQWMLTGAQNPAGTADVLLAAAAGAAAWWLSGRLTLLPYPVLARPLATAAAASYASQQGIPAVAAAARYMPLAPAMPLAAGLGVVGLLAYYDRRWLRYWWPPLAWLLRAPLAAAVLALALYPTAW